MVASGVALLWPVSNESEPCSVTRVKQFSIPVYTPLARQLRRQGSVTVDLVVASDGKVLQQRIKGDELALVDSVTKSLIDWSFLPAAGGPCKTRITFEFRLDGALTEKYAPTYVYGTFPHHIKILTQPPQFYGHPHQ